MRTNYLDVTESRARRVAKRAGLIARKSRWRRDTVDNWGGFMLIEPYRNVVIAGSRYDLSPEEVVEICEAKNGHDGDQS
jgi:hypothetical protein